MGYGRPQEQINSALKKASRMEFLPSDNIHQIYGIAVRPKFELSCLSTFIFTHYKHQRVFSTLLSDAFNSLSNGPCVFPWTSWGLRFDKGVNVKLEGDKSGSTCGPHVCIQI